MGNVEKVVTLCEALGDAPSRAPAGAEVDAPLTHSDAGGLPLVPRPAALAAASPPRPETS